MPLNTVSPRSDVVFIKRRLRKGESAAPVAPKKRSISLSGAVEEHSAAPSVPTRTYLTKDVTLAADNPVVRLNRRQSAIGSITIEGATEFAWEADHRKGRESLTQPDSTVPSYGNRKIVQFHKGFVVIGAKHFMNLRRVIVFGGSNPLTMRTSDGSTIRIESDSEPRVLYISRIGREIEVRYEKIDDTNNFAATFSL